MDFNLDLILNLKMKNKNTMFIVFFHDKSPKEENVAEFCMRRIYPEKRENVVTIDASWAY